MKAVHQQPDLVQWAQLQADLVLGSLQTDFLLLQAELVPWVYLEQMDLQMPMEVQEALVLEVQADLVLEVHPADLALQADHHDGLQPMNERHG